MNQIYNSDKPIENKSSDRFNRHKFSSRVAQTIIDRKSPLSFEDIQASFITQMIYFSTKINSLFFIVFS